MGSRTMLIAGNWKMNGTRADADGFLEKLAGLKPERRSGRTLLICPPATLVGRMARPLDDLGVFAGGQDCHPEGKGAFTGEISAAMLKDAGVTYVIVGHSERRAMHGETDAIVCDKARAALHHGLIPIICVGETLAEREAGQADAIVKAQIAGSVPDGIDGASLVVAYERYGPSAAVGRRHWTTSRRCTM